MSTSGIFFLQHPAEAADPQLSDFERHLRAEQEVAAADLSEGNQATLLDSGPAAYTAMYAAMQSARSTINLETYIFDDDNFGQAVADLLLDKVAHGVAVNVIYDCLGSRGTTARFFERLRAGGVKVLPYHPLNLAHLPHVNQRDHRKILIVDGATAFTGGVNISNAFTKSPFIERGVQKLEARHDTWRDTHVRLDGPGAAGIQKLFLQMWQQLGGQPLPESRYLPAVDRQGGLIARTIATLPGRKAYAILDAFVHAIRHARHSIHWTTAYFAPSPPLVKALVEAAQRGVKVDLIVPGYGETGLVYYAKRSYYTQLLKAGIRIYERRGCMLHAKTAVIDGVWSTVGSANLDNRSFQLNEEANVVILGQEFARQLDQLFQSDFHHSDPVVLEEWQKRATGERTRERLARLFEYWL